MSDDLKKRLLDWEMWDEGDINDAREEAHARIEELCVLHREYEKILTERIEELEAKLAKAMSALSEHSTARCFGSGEVLGLSLSDSPMGREILARMDHARTVLAELEGELDD
jgi:hypothetical protein